MIPSMVSVSFRLAHRWRPVRVGVVLLGLLLAVPLTTHAQAPLYLINEETTVRQISFRFVHSQTFEPSRLQHQIATEAPSFFDRVRNLFDWLPLVAEAPEYPFDPVTLQRDVVRLRRFYQENGFLNPRIDYPASQLDTTSNTIHVIFSIEEGPPVIIQSVDFYGSDSTQYAAAQFDEDGLRDAWMDFRDRMSFRLGERYTRFRRLQIADEVWQWLQNRGFAFARVNSDARIDTTNSTADIRFFLDAGPRARVGEIEIDGNESVERRIVERELPLQVGDYFSHDRLIAGQRQLFGLNLFRVALADVPPQPRDSTVTVRYRVREANIRYLSAQTGYGTSAGLTSEGQWTHRNFLGGARNLTVGLVAETGLLSNPGLLSTSAREITPDRLFRGSIALRQPYLFSTRLSANVEPFLAYRQSRFFEPSNEFLDINARDFGLNTALIYEIYPFRTVSLQHTFTRSLHFTRPLEDPPTEDPGGPGDPINGDPADPTLPDDPTSDLYNRSVFSVNATLGRLDDYLNPTEGFQVSPSAALAGTVLGSSVEYARLSNEVSGYLPLNNTFELAGRLYVGRLWPLGKSRARLDAEDPVFEDRFAPIRFYTGGSNDLRGWNSDLAGEKNVRQFTQEDETWYDFEPVGGNTKLAANLELRLPFPGLGNAWRSAFFLDAGQVRERSFAPTALRFGTGTGIRYRTPVGYLRLDVAYKLNPGPFDLRSAEQVYRHVHEGEPLPDPSFIRRFKIHVGIGQSF